MTLRVFVEWCKHNGEDNLDIVRDQVAKVFVVPEIQGSLSDLQAIRLIVAFFDLLKLPGNEGLLQTLQAG